MGQAVRTTTRTRLAILAVLAAALAAGGWWHWQPRSARPLPAEVVEAPAAPPPGATAPPTPADPAAAGPEPDALAAEAAEAAPTTESDPPQVHNGMSWGRLLGLHNTRDDLRLQAAAAYVMEPASGKVLFEKNQDAVLPIASLTKLMTALVVTDAALPLDEVVTITDEDVDTERHSRSRLRVGTTLPRAEALRLALMSSENRAAHALGRHYPGGLPAFVAAMNRKARALGMKSSTFVDPTGLSNRNRSTARDVALLAAAASRVPLVREYSTTPEHLALLGPRTMRFNNSNRLVKSPYWDVNLQKTGYIVEAGQCLTMNTTVAGRDVVLVLLDSRDKHSRLQDAERIRLFAGGEPPPAPRVAARPGGKRQAVAKARTKGPRAQQVAKGKAKGARTEQVAKARPRKGEGRVRQTYAGRPAARQQRDQGG